jgi:hypothetical protein
MLASLPLSSLILDNIQNTGLCRGFEPGIYHPTPFSEQEGPVVWRRRTRKPNLRLCAEGSPKFLAQTKIMPKIVAQRPPSLRVNMMRAMHYVFVGMNLKDFHFDSSYPIRLLANEVDAAHDRLHL